MDAFALPSIHGETPADRSGRPLGTLLTTLLLGLSLVGGGLGRPDSYLDASWQEMLIQAHASGLQFGRDIIFTWGPWGFLCNGYHLGRLEAAPILFWQTAGQFLIAYALATLTRKLVPWRRIAFVCAFLAFHWLFLDTAYFVLVTLVGVAGLMDRDSSVLRMVAWTIVLGFVSQLKFTYLMIAAAAALASMAYWAGRGDWRRVGAVACGYLVSVAGAWMAAGQHLDNLYPFVRRSLEISSGYADAMGLDESWATFISGATFAVVCVLFVWRAWRTAAEPVFGKCASGLLAFLLFVAWKESFIRADQLALGGHVFGFFCYILILAPVLPGLLFPGRRWHWFDLSLPLGLIAFAWFDPEYYRQAPLVMWQRAYGNTLTLRHLSTRSDEWQQSLEKAGELESLPAIRRAVGRGTVDVYNFNLGKALLNGMSISARPIFQSYSAYSPSLEGWNLRFYQSEHAPDFLLWNDDGVDVRYPGQDDARLVAGLPGHYEPVLSERGYWLFRKLSPLARAHLDLRMVIKRSLAISEELPMPEGIDHALWLRVQAVPNNLGRLRALLYRPALINLSTTGIDGARSVWRLLPRVAADGFILAPRLEGGSDVAALMSGDARTWVRSIHFEAPAGQEEFWSHMDVEVYSMPGLPIDPGSPFSAWAANLGILDRPAIRVSSEKPLAIVFEGEKRLLVHAPAEVAVAIPAGARRVSWSYGIREGAYTSGGNTQGVEFSVDAEWPSGRKERLWSRYLDPVSVPGDRGTQRVDLAVPSAVPSRLVLRAGVGRNDERWDWSYVSGVHFDSKEGQ
jgi:hypothetical protein